MCRWLAYAGKPVYLHDVLFKPENSLIHQSLHARKSHVTINGDGFGVGWYDSKSDPGLYRDVRPAWNDENLLSVSEQIRSRLFFAHVRASTGTSTTRLNCHPFRFGRWLFMHNGQIGGYDQVARDVEFAIAPAYYRLRRGSTDSEAIFYLLISNGLAEDPVGAFARTVGLIEDIMQRAAITEPLRITAAVTDGDVIYALRYSSDRASPSLFFGGGGCCFGADATDAMLVVSEPLDTDMSHWSPIAEGSLLSVTGGQADVRAFHPVH